MTKKEKAMFLNALFFLAGDRHLHSSRQARARRRRDHIRRLRVFAII